MSIDSPSDEDRRFMARAIELARRGEGRVEPNPMVGCVLVGDGRAVGEGWHRQYGGPHAEIEALRAAGPSARGATAYVSLEPCAHAGKTPPCTEALLAAGVKRVVAGCRDPHPQVDGRGFAELSAAGVEVADGVLADAAQELIAPFAKLATQGIPWVIAKWAMTLDGNIAARSGDSRWISGEESRSAVHALRGRVDAIVVGRGTAAADDPLLTARPPGPRAATRIVLDSQAALSLSSKLVATAGDVPVLVAASATAPPERCEALRQRGVEVWQSTNNERATMWLELLRELGGRQVTNVLVEGGAEVFGAIFDADSVDEVHAFIAPRIIGGSAAPPCAGPGVATIADALNLSRPGVEQLGSDVHVYGRIVRPRR
jgi:diaminohydroxyphosphoribosylaminopyrimidine deaminase/5-amino-6-(5-phosphoribosylamino)uracil reductase